MAANGVKRAQATSGAESRLQSSLEEKARDLEARILAPLGDPTAEKTSNYKANWGDVALANEADLTVTLPLAQVDRVGQIIPVKNLHSTDVTVQPSGSDTIDGTAASVAVPSAACFGYMCVAVGEWIELWRPAVAAPSSGWVWLPTAVKTGSYACTAFYELVLCDNSGGGVTVTLPTITAADVGKMVAVKSVTNSVSGAISVNPASGQTSYDSEAYTTAKRAVVFVAVTATKWAAVMDYEPEMMG